jgi:hypothetical protein
MTQNSLTYRVVVCLEEVGVFNTLHEALAKFQEAIITIGDAHGLSLQAFETACWVEAHKGLSSAALALFNPYMLTSIGKGLCLIDKKGKLVPADQVLQDADSRLESVLDEKMDGFWFKPDILGGIIAEHFEDEMEKKARS